MPACFQLKYNFQAVFTFLYIHLLAQVGERVAARMKQDLFVSILNQDVAFFDQERTGELLNRYYVTDFVLNYLDLGS